MNKNFFLLLGVGMLALLFLKNQKKIDPELKKRVEAMSFPDLVLAAMEAAGVDKTLKNLELFKSYSSEVLKKIIYGK